jgi:hypothetical protein
MQLLNFLSLGLVAALASCANAEHNHGYVHQYFKRQYYGNETTSLTTTMATSTVCSTVTETITHCPKYVKDCPAESTETRTRTIPISMTSYPVITTTTGAVHTSHGVPYGTGSSAPVYSSYTKATETSPEKTTTTTIDTTVTRYTTVTYTTGHGSSQSVVTSTMPVTNTKYNTHTVYATRSSDSKTTTYHTTSTTTSYVTVYPVPTSGTETNGVPTGGAPSGGSSCKPSKVTVTETEKETIYVTMTPESPETTKTLTRTSYTTQLHTVTPYQSKSHYYPNPSSSNVMPIGTGGSYSSSTYSAMPTSSAYAPRYPPSYGGRR